MLEVLDRPVLDDTDNDEDIDHYFCQCSENIAICGADLTGVPEVPEGDDDFSKDCKKCRKLAYNINFVCVLCGN